MIINLADYLFHSPGYWNEKTKNKLDSIINSGYIFNREDMLNYFSSKANHYFESTNPSGGKKWISLSKYPTLHGQTLNKYLNMSNGNEKDAYIKYVLMYYRISLLLDKIILKSFKTRQKGYKNEIQVLGSIPFTYVRAISISLENSSSILNMSGHEIVDYDIYQDLKIINYIYEILLNHNLDIPFLDSETGKVLKKINL